MSNWNYSQSQLKEQKDSVRRMSQSPCQCLVYHPAPNTEDFENLYKEWIGDGSKLLMGMRESRTALLAQLIANCPYQQK
jgi:hypothetical protein